MTVEMSKAEKALREKGFSSFRPGGELNVHPIPEILLEPCPEPVVKESKRLSDALARREKAESDLLNAQAASRQASAADTEAVRSAVSAEKPLPKTTLPKAVEAESDALKVRQAAHELVLEGQRELAWRMFEHQPEYLKALREEDDRAQGELRDTVEKLEPLVRKATATRWAVREVEHMTPSPRPDIDLRRPPKPNKALERLAGLYEALLS